MAPAVRFRQFRLDPQRRALWRDDERVELPPLAFDVLAYLVEHRDRAVGRAELVSAVWGRVDVSDNLVNQVMLRCRRAIGDNEEPRYAIRTVARFGFAWIAPVEILPDDALAPATTPDSAAAAIDATATPPAHADAALPATAAVPAKRPASRPLPEIWQLLALIALSAAAVLLHGWYDRRPSATPAPPTAVADPAAPRTVIVLPLQGTMDSSHAWMRLGLMDAMAERLRRSGQPVMPSDNVIALLRGVPAEPRAQQAAVSKAAADAQVFEARIEASAGQWRVSLSQAGSGAVAASAEAADPLAAAYLAADQLARTQGWLALDANAAGSSDGDLGPLLQQVKAAVWAEQPAQARALLQAASTQRAAELEVRYWLAEIDLQTGKDLPARGAFEQLLADTRLAQQPELRARVLYGLAYTYLRQSDYAAAERYFDATLGAADTAPVSASSRHTQALAYLGRGAARTSQRNYRAAQDDFLQARVGLEATGDQLGRARLDNALGVLQERRGRVSEAVPHFTQAAQRAAVFNAVQPELRARINLMRDELLLLNPAAALAQQRRVGELLQRTGDLGLRQFANLVQVQVLDANGRLREAAALLERIEAESAPGLDGAQLAWKQMVSAEHALVRQQPALAAELAAAAANPALEAASPGDFAYARYLQVVAQLQQNRIADAAATATAARDWRAPPDADRAGAIYAYITWARYSDARNDNGAATSACTRALELAAGVNMPQILLDASRTCALHALRKGDIATAFASAGRSAEWAEQSFDAALLQLQLHHARGDAAAWQVARQRALGLAGEREIPTALMTLDTAAAQRVNGTQTTH